MPASDPRLCRASVHSGATVVDLALPTTVPVAVLIPSIVDILQAREPGNDVAAKRYQLSRLGAPALDPSSTLAQNGIDDGVVLLLSQPATPLPAPRYDDVAEAVSATLDAVPEPWSRPEHRQAVRLSGAVAASCLTGVGTLVLIRNTFRASAARDFGSTAQVAALAGFVALVLAAIACRKYRDTTAGLTLSMIATAFASLAGFLAVPGVPGLPNALLAATAATAAPVLAMRASGCGTRTLTAVASAAMVIAVATLVGVVTAAPVRAVGSVAALMSLALLGLAPRISITLAGLSPQLNRDDVEPNETCVATRALRADAWLVSLLTAWSSSAAAGAVVTVFSGAHRLCCFVFGFVAGTLLLLRGRCDDSRRMLVFTVSGTVVAATTFGLSAARAPEYGPWIAVATALLSVAALCVGRIAPAISSSPSIRRCVELLEYLAFVAMVPLACWIWGLYGAARSLTLR